MTGLAALLGSGTNPNIDPHSLRLGTIQSSPNFTQSTVLLDGADTAVTVNYQAGVNRGGMAQLFDRVLVGQIGTRLYIVENLTVGYGNMGGNLAASGTFGSAAPPNGTTGTSFNVTRSASYLFTFSGTAYNTTGAQTCTLTTWIDGTSRLAAGMFINPANSHMTFPTSQFTLFLFGGTHYWYLQLTGTNATSDANDRAYLSWIAY